MLKLNNSIGGKNKGTSFIFKVLIKWRILVFYFYCCAECLLFLCSICRVEASLKANLSGSGELASGTVMLGSPGSSAWLGAAQFGPKLGIWLPGGDLSSWEALMKTQVVPSYFCSELLHFITRRSTAPNEKSTERIRLTVLSLHNTHRGGQTHHDVKGRRGRGQREWQI